MVDTVVEVDDLLKTGLGCLVFTLDLSGGVVGLDFGSNCKSRNTITYRASQK